MLLVRRYIFQSRGFALLSIISRVFSELICWTACDRAADIKYGFCCKRNLPGLCIRLTHQSRWGHRLSPGLQCCGWRTWGEGTAVQAAAVEAPS